MSVEDAIARRATALLLAVAGGDANAAVLYEDLLARMLYEVASRRGHYLAVEAARRLNLPTAGPLVRAADEDEVASVAVQLALKRARGSALRFDPARGDGASWALGALGPAYLDAARQVTRSRRAMTEVPLGDDVDLPAAASADPELVAETRDGLARALAELTADERFVVLARLHYGFTYAEIAERLFGDVEATKRVDRLLQAARVKLRAAEQRWVSGE